MTTPTIIVDITPLIKLFDRELFINSYDHNGSNNERSISFKLVGQHPTSLDDYSITVNGKHLAVHSTVYPTSMGGGNSTYFDILKKNLSQPLLLELINKVETTGLTWVNSIL